MAAATAAVSSPFSTSIQTLNCNIRSKIWSSPDPSTTLRIPSTNTSLTVPMISISQNSLGIDQITPIIGENCRWRVQRVPATVEEAAVTAETVEEVEEEGVSSGSSVGGGAVEEGSSVNTKLYFGNLPYLCDSAQLAGIIQDYASPELVEVLYDRDTGKSRGFAFVTMSSLEDCRTVIENLDGREYGGRTLRVNFSDKPKPKEPLYPETEFKLFVGNLSWSVTSESLTQVFQEYGNVVGARVLYDGETGRSRGYGFVSYSSKSEMDTALQALNGVELEGRTMRVSLAQGKRQ